MAFKVCARCEGRGFYGGGFQCEHCLGQGHYDVGLPLEPLWLQHNRAVTHGFPCTCGCGLNALPQGVLA